jgi:hypothetical protein
MGISRFSKMYSAHAYVGLKTNNQYAPNTSGAPDDKR